MPTSNTCFGILPFENSTKRFEDVVKPLVESLTGLQYLDARAFYEPNQVKMGLIARLIEEAQLIIADLSEKNPNVFLEYGIAYSLRKPIVSICSKKAHEAEDGWNGKMPFDIEGRELLIFKDERELRVQLGRYIFDALHKTRFAPVVWKTEPFEPGKPVENRATPSQIDILDNGRIWSTLAVSPPFTVRYDLEIDSKCSKPDLRTYFAQKPDGKPPCIMTIFPWEGGDECHVDYVDHDEKSAKRLCVAKIGKKSTKAHIFISFAPPHFVFESSEFDDKTPRLVLPVKTFDDLGYSSHAPQHIGFMAPSTQVTITRIEIKEILR